MADDEKVPEPGSICAVKKLYNHSSYARKSLPTWSDIEDPTLEEKRVKQLGESHAIIHRFSRHKLANGRATWTTHSVEVQSPLLRKALDTLFRGYPHWAPDDSPYTLFPPFKPLLHRWQQWTSMYNAETDKRTKMEMRIFRKELEPLMSSDLSALQEAKASGVITFEMLWAVYAPGELVVYETWRSTCVSKILATKLVKPPKRIRRRDLDDSDTSYLDSEDSADDDSDEIYDSDDSDDEDGHDKRPYWKVTLGQIEWNGSWCGVETDKVKIRQFRAARQISRLLLCPLALAGNEQKIRDRVLARGKKFESLRGYHLMVCKGRKFVPGKDAMGNPIEVAQPVSGRVVVDAFAYYRCQKQIPPSLPRLVNDEDAEPGTGASGLLPEPKDAELGERHEDLRPLTDDERLLAVPLVRGLDLATKTWCRLEVDNLEPPVWDPSPYNNLVLPEGERELLIAVADHRQAQLVAFDDFVKAKGRGVIVLLCGPAGVGKTLTAEAVAENSKAPLYVLSAGDLGSTPDKLEPALESALECCQLWGAMLLLDEADVFLQSRGSDSMKRNELVSIFLRQLEYYQGLLFLTTNRIGAIDSAFRSRIDLIVPYSPLDVATRKKIWVNFIQRLPSEAVQLRDEDIDELAKNELNGREIKNLLKTALIVAARDKSLRMHHFELMLGVRKRATSLGLDMTT
ncbi:RasGAP protein [Hypoxylon texense]